MTQEQQFELQALLDGELSAGEVQRVECAWPTTPRPQRSWPN
jgi:hypothetical protein